MEKINIKKIVDVLPEGKSTLVCGLPGIGNVGRITVDYMVEKLKMEKVLEIYSSHFPAQVFVDSEGKVHLNRNTLFYKKLSKTKSLFVFTGDFQGNTPEGQYELSWKLLDIAREMNVGIIYTLGGYGVGKLVESPRILGAFTDSSLKADLIKNGVKFPEGEPGGGIVGSNGLIVGLAYKFFRIPAACLMGETSGYFPDPKAALEILKALSKLIGIKISLSDMEERCKNLSEITDKMQSDMADKEKKDDLGYFQ
ncbi:MAG: proteasome assembly chaperone family protein [Candidatus Thermoplasmatota archaeon]|nr:proteasome assembly chaperone family protein [Candidatus Thermoplasmatota archaeon]MCL5888615.1 proteasome assembly chaperone family protein [Candidatus Thermoplasmatota archaeon]